MLNKDKQVCNEYDLLINCNFIMCENYQFSVHPLSWWNVEAVVIFLSSVQAESFGIDQNSQASSVCSHNFYDKKL